MKQSSASTLLKIPKKLYLLFSLAFSEFLGRTEIKLSTLLSDTNTRKGPVSMKLPLCETESGTVTIRIDIQHFWNKKTKKTYTNFYCFLQLLKTWQLFSILWWNSNHDVSWLFRPQPYLYQTEAKPMHPATNTSSKQCNGWVASHKYALSRPLRLFLTMF